MFVSQSKTLLALLPALLGLTLAAPARAEAAPRNASSATASDADDLVLQVGEQRVLSSNNVRTYSLGSDGIVDVRLTKDATEFVIVATAPGSTTLLFLMNDGSERRYRFVVPDPNAGKAGAEPGVVPARDNVRLDFYFVQVNRSYGRQIGLGWPSSVAPTLSASYDFKLNALENATAVVSNQALPRLDMAESAGWAKVMRQAAVVTANGSKASFSGGGEVNVAVQGALTSGIQKIPFGSLIEVEPHYDSNSGRIELQIHADISELENDHGTGIPGRTTSSLDTIVNIELGQSLILAGLTAKSERTEHQGLPGLSQIPIFGVFFGTHNHAEDETENVVVIVPSVVDTVSMQDRERLSDALKQYEDFSGATDDVAFVPKTSVTPVSHPGRR